MADRDMGAIVRYVTERHAHAEGKERVRLGAMLGYAPEPCRIWENTGEHYMYCSTHAEMWHLHKPKPSVACFVDQAPETSGSRSSRGSEP